MEHHLGYVKVSVVTDRVCERKENERDWKWKARHQVSGVMLIIGPE